jgi:hypothetical protein
VEITVLPEPLIVQIAGGDRIEGTDTQITIDASMSHDPSGVQGFEMAFAWTCYMQYPDAMDVLPGLNEGPCVSNRNEILNFTTATVQIIAPDTLYGSLGGLAYVFTCSAQKYTNISSTEDLRFGSATVTLYLVPGQPPKVEIASLPGKVNADSRRVLEGKTISRVPWTMGVAIWDVLDGSLDLDDPDVTTTGRYGRPGSSFANLVINANRMVPGQAMRFRLSVTDANGASYSEVAFIVNTAPSGGRFGALPHRGTAMNTSFMLRVSSWADDVSDLPLKTRFLYEDKSGKEQALTAFDVNQQAPVFLPPGMPVPVSPMPKLALADLRTVLYICLNDRSSIFECHCRLGMCIQRLFPGF